MSQGTGEAQLYSTFWSLACSCVKSIVELCVVCCLNQTTSTILLKHSYSFLWKLSYFITIRHIRFLSTKNGFLSCFILSWNDFLYLLNCSSINRTISLNLSRFLIREQDAIDSTFGAMQLFESLDNIIAILMNEWSANRKKSAILTIKSRYNLTINRTNISRLNRRFCGDLADMGWCW